MQQKTLFDLLGTNDFNANLFSLSVQAVKTVRLLSPPAPHSQKTIKETLASFALAVGVQKSVNIGFMGHAVNIFESLTDLIELSVKKLNELKQHKRAVPICNSLSISRQIPFRPIQFSHHSHSDTPCRYRFDLECQLPQSIQKEVIYVANETAFEQMLITLAKESEIAVDVEHSNRSYEGLTCLLQLSSRCNDYIVDVFAVWDRVHELKCIFQDSTVIKVMHGAQMDVRWLQRDFDIHIINLFDTHRAARALGLSKLSYAHLLHYYCNIIADKQYQKADWRLRPLPPPMLHYARMDTHYLLYIFDRMRTDISNKARAFQLDPESALRDVYKASHSITLLQARLFDYEQKQLFLSLRKETNSARFAVIEGLFEAINKVAYKENIHFDQLVPEKILVQLIARMKELLLDRSGLNTQVKIEKMIAVLQSKSVNSQLLLIELKHYLTSAVAAYKQTTKQQLKPMPPIAPQPLLPSPNSVELNSDNNQVPQQKRQNKLLKFLQYETKRFYQPKSRPFCPLQFQRINTFLAAKYSLQMKPEAAIENQRDQEVEVNEPQDMMVEVQQNQNDIISFKKYNPSVMYTVEKDPVIINAAKPKKKIKEAEYEKRLRTKIGNVYQLLDE